MKALFCKISHDLKAVQGSASVYYENVCMCSRGYFLLCEALYVFAIWVSTIWEWKWNVPGGLCARSTQTPASAFCHLAWLTGIHCTMYGQFGTMQTVSESLLMKWPVSQNTELQEEIMFKQPQHLLDLYFANPRILKHTSFHIKHTSVCRDLC